MPLDEVIERWKSDERIRILKKPGFRFDPLTVNNPTSRRVIGLQDFIAYPRQDLDTADLNGLNQSLAYYDIKDVWYRDKRAKAIYPNGLSIAFVEAFENSGTIISRTPSVTITNPKFSDFNVRSKSKKIILLDSAKLYLFPSYTAARQAEIREDGVVNTYISLK